MAEGKRNIGKNTGTYVCIWPFFMGKVMLNSTVACGVNDKVEIHSGMDIGLIYPIVKDSGIV